MTNIKYEDWNPKEETIMIVDHAVSIIEDYQEQGYELTLRQLYYRMVGYDMIPNTERSYKRLGNIVTRARMAGMISWEAIEDRNREVNEFWFEEDITTPVRNMPYYIRFDKWARQDYYLEVWVEKEALGNVIQRACEDLRVNSLSCKGYLSASEAWRASQRMERKISEGKMPKIIHLGDHDPSGLDMTRDNQDRIDTFTYAVGVPVERIALNIDQIHEHRPPPNPAKQNDSRFKDDQREHGNKSWELDALEPSIIERLIKDTIEPHIDWDTWHSTDEEERDIKQRLQRVYEHWDSVEDHINELESE